MEAAEYLVKGGSYRWQVSKAENGVYQPNQNCEEFLGQKLSSSLSSRIYELVAFTDERRNMKNRRATGKFKGKSHPFSPRLGQQWLFTFRSPLEHAQKGRSNPARDYFVRRMHDQIRQSAPLLSSAVSVRGELIRTQITEWSLGLFR